MKKLKMKICVFLVLFLFIGVSSISGQKIGISSDNDQIFDEIERIKDKQLIYDSLIGDVHVMYWEHVIDGVYVKNDYIKIHVDPVSDEIVKFDKKWTNLEGIPEINDLNIEDVFWKKPVVFLIQEDLGYFYSFYEDQEYPMFCWEVRTKTGETKLFSLDGDEIGFGVPTPYLGFSLSGFHEESWPDPWIDWRLNADSWFSQWCDSTVNIPLPSPSTISSYVSNPDYELFFELAHGAETYFQADWYGSYYTSSMTEVDMQNREKMRFAFIGSCHGMTTTGPGTFSYEFRKGEMTETVTIGYDHMEECPGWSVALPWQDLMFYLMDLGYTVKAAFDEATATYPEIAPAVVFVGDETMRVREEEDEEDPEPPENEPPHCSIITPHRNEVIEGKITISGTAYDSDGAIKQVCVQIDRGPYMDAQGTNDWSYAWDTTQEEDGEHLIIAVAWDGTFWTASSTVVIVHNEEEEPERNPDLSAEGNLNWVGIKPGMEVKGEFTVQNKGDSGSTLNWKVSECPDWGSWRFNPTTGNGLTPENGAITVKVTVMTPGVSEESFSGNVKIINLDDPNDYETIEVDLATPKNRVLRPLIYQFLQNHPLLFELFSKLF